MRTQIFDDGSVLTYDELDRVVSGVDSGGAPLYVPPAEGSPIVQQFTNLFNYGVRAVYDLAASKNRQAATAGAPRLQASPLQRYVPIALLIGGGLLAYKLLLAK